MTRQILVATTALLLLAACAPTTSAPSTTAAERVSCRDDTRPTVAVLEFQNTGAGYGGGSQVLGVESAATARLINLMVNSGCYQVIERSQLQQLIAAEGLESTDPAELARAAGAGYVVTGVVTRATLSRPSGGIAGFAGGMVEADISVDIRATDVITGQVVASIDARGNARNARLDLRGVPLAGTVAYDNPTYGPVVADAAEAAMIRALQEMTLRF